MSEYPAVEFPRAIAGALASFFQGGAGPTHPSVTSAIAVAGLEPGPMGNTISKEARVNAAFQRATREERYTFAEELLLTLRNYGAFDGMASADQVARLESAFRRAGFSLDGEGYPTWTPADGKPAAAPVPTEELIHPNVGMVARSIAAVGRAEAAANEVWGPPAVPGAYSAGDAVGPLPTPTGSPAAAPKIFLVHGHDEAARNAVEVFITRTTGITPTVLALEASGGLTVIEKFEKHADSADYAVVLMTADDVGNAKEVQAKTSVLHPRPRQNVVFEFGYFVGALRRKNVAALVPYGVEKPSDIAGLVYIPFAPGSDWKEDLRREMGEAGIPIK